MSKGFFAAVAIMAFALSTSIPASGFAQSPSTPSDITAAIGSSVAARLTIPAGAVTTVLRQNMVEVSIRSAKPNIDSAAFHSESSVIAEEVVAKISNNPDYLRIHTIRIKHLEMAANGRIKTLHVVDYRRNLHGIFESHST